MNKIEKLLEEFCPQGVEFKMLNEISVISGAGVDKKINHDEKHIKLLNYMDVYRNRYIDCKIPTMEVTASNKKIVQCNILRGDIFFTPSSEVLNDIGNSAVAINDISGTVYSYHIMRIRLNEPVFITAMYINYILESDYVQKQINKNAKGITRFGLTKTQWEKIKIPIPPLTIQKEIVKILDNFTQLEAELEAELEARKKQYEYYREQLLMVNDEGLMVDGTKVEFRALGEVLDYEQPTKYIVSSTKYSDDFTMPVLTAGQSFILGYTSEREGIYNANKCNPVVIFDDFTTAFHWVDFNFKVKSSAMKMVRPQQNTNIDFRFVYFAMRCIGYRPQDHARHWISKYSKFKIPIPPLAKQQEIVAILDKFDALVNDISTGLPAEIVARKKQYNYYRNQLLNFKPLDAQDAN